MNITGVRMGQGVQEQGYGPRSTVLTEQELAELLSDRYLDEEPDRVVGFRDVALAAYEQDPEVRQSAYRMATRRMMAHDGTKGRVNESTAQHEWMAYCRSFLEPCSDQTTVLDRACRPRRIESAEESDRQYVFDDALSEDTEIRFHWLGDDAYSTVYSTEVADDEQGSASAFDVMVSEGYGEQ